MIVTSELKDNIAKSHYHNVDTVEILAHQRIALSLFRIRGVPRVPQTVQIRTKSLERHMTISGIRLSELHKKTCSTWSADPIPFDAWNRASARSG